MRIRWRILACLCLGGLLVWFLADAGAVRDSVAEALALCARSVVPSLFPFFVLSSLVVELIGSMGVSIDCAETGQQAVERFKASPEGYYDLIFMDIQMPVMNGHDATRAIRALEREDARQVPIVAMSANVFAEDIQAAERAGMDGHLPKPIDLALLRDTLRRWL